MLHGFSKSMFHRKFHRALPGAKNCLGFSDIPKKSPAPQLALQLSQRSSASLLARLDPVCGGVLGVSCSR
jgi:hypothetical protein